MKKLSLDRVLQSQGFGSRKDCRFLIRSGEVQLAGQVVRAWETEVEPTGLELMIKGQPVRVRERVYLALNKPAGYECSRQSSHHFSVFDLLPAELVHRDVQPAGRLDQDTSGLLILSDDGPFLHRLASPKHHVPKVYLVTTADPVTDEQVAELLAGVQLHGEDGLLAALACRRQPDGRLELSLGQGRYHQVKRMLAAVGNRVTGLTRTAVGRLELAGLSLAEGGWCYLETADLERLLGVRG